MDPPPHLRPRRAREDVIRLRLGVALSTLLALASLAPAAGTLDLIDGGGDADVRVLSADDRGLELLFTLPSLDVEDVTLDGRDWRRLSIPGGALVGSDGRAALPVFGSLLDIPDGVGLRTEILEMKTVDLEGWRIAPAEAPETETTVVDDAWYAAPKTDLAPGCDVGDPAVLRDLRVAPVTFRPLDYDPLTGRVRVATSMRVRVSFEGVDKRNDVPVRHASVPHSFDDFYRAHVLNYDPAAKSLHVEQGTYLVICPNDATVISYLQPRLDSRRRQGYNVVLATTSETGTTNTSIKNYIQTAYDTWKPALEYVTLVGDASGTVSIPAWTEGLSGYGGGGDHYYTNLAGGDVLADIHIGRLSVSSTTELNTVVNKIVDYETAPPTSAAPGWFTRATLVGDPGTSGITCIFVNQWAKAQLPQHNYTQIDTVWGGNFATEMQTRYSNGGTLFTYRGWLGMSGFGSSNIMNLTNGGELGFAVVITCDTGSFASDGNCRSEAFLRAPNGGGVAGIGTATIGTHTRYNNCVFTGVVDHAWNSGDYRVGPALSNGKLAMYNNYNVGEPSKVEIWSVWNNLMGDPATPIWTALPGEILVDHPAELAMGANAVDVTVTDRTTGLPMPGALVSVYKAGEIRFSAEADASGRVVLPIDGYTAGDLDLTVQMHNYLPQERTVVLGTASDLLALQTVNVDDTDWGDSDGALEAGEHVQLAVQVHNFGTTTATGVSGVLSSHDPYVTVNSAAATFADVAPGADVWGSPMFEITVDPSTPGGHATQLDLVVTTGTKTYTSIVEVTVQGPDLDYVSASYGGAGGTPDPGETGTVTLSLANRGNAASGTVSATLETDSPWVSITDPAGSFASIGVDLTGDNAGDTFAISVGTDCYPGHLAAFRALTTTADGATDVIEFTMTVGSAVSTDPVGPDGYGYYAYDDTDTGYDEAPIYAWTEIDPTLGGAGTSVGLTDGGWEEDDTVLFDLPFDFTFYGETFSQISICSNGWVSMGPTQSRQYRNWALPTAGAADGMIAGFWDNLFQNGATGGVFQWYDAAQNRLVIEWSRMTAMWSEGSTGPQQTFAIILYDPAHHPTPTGDGMIDVMYQTVNNGDSTNGYATAGLMNLDHTDGLTYEYWNTPAAGAADLVAGRAVRYLAYESVPTGTLQGTVTNLTGGGAPAEGVMISVLGAGRAFGTAADGTYLGNVPGGTYDVVASHPSFAADTTYGVTIVVDQTTVADFQLTDIAGPAFSGVTILPDTDDTVGPYVVDVTISDFTGVAEQHFWYMSTAVGGPVELPLTVIDAGTGLHRAEIPGQPDGSRVVYWLTGEDTAGNASSSSPDAPADAYDFRVEDTAITAHEMEADDGWVAGDAGDTATAGIWTRVDPNGIVNGSVQVVPEDDHTTTGTMCWITGQDAVGGNQGGNDVDGGLTTLTSPVFDLSGYAVATVGYWRWYTNDTGYNPGSDWWVVQVNDGSGWVDLERTQASLREWMYMEFDLQGLISLTSTVQFRFLADDDGGGSVVECGVDDFTLNGRTSVLDTAAPTATLIYPNGGEIIMPATVGLADAEVEWTSSDDTGVTRTVLLMSRDGGVSWPDTLADGALTSPLEPNWPSFNGLECRVKVVVFDAELNAALDASDGDFQLQVNTGVEDDLPRTVILGRNAPNPFNPATEIRFTVPRDGKVSLKVYDLSGRLVRTLVSGRLDAGGHAVTWHGDDDRGARTASGTYFYRLEAAGEVLTRKMTLIK